MDPVERQRRLVLALCDPARHPGSVARVEHRETHISHVLLAGDRAYKFKKPVDLGFLDFTALADRRHYCREELRLNRRLAPSLYLDVLPVTGSVDAPLLGGPGEAIEYAVLMARFDECGLLDRLAGEGRLQRRVVVDLARRIAAFHAAADREPPPGLGEPDAVIAPCRENFRVLRPCAGPGLAPRLEALAAWTERRHAELVPFWRARRDAGGVRECHGDLHLGNIALIDGTPTMFDGIEFDPAMRWIDVVSDTAFLAMDLDHRGAPGLAGVLLDEWLAASGDYEALAGLRFHLVYRALVRAKIAAIRRTQVEDADAAAAQGQALEAYLGLAERYAGARAPAVIVMRGVAGSGKSTAAAALVERLGAVRLRADVERRRLYPDPDPAVRYAPSSHAVVYERLRALADTVVRAGFPAVIDATCLEAAHRAPFLELAAAHGVPARILDLAVPEARLAERIEARNRAGDDPSEAGPDIMRDQLARLEALTDAERALALTVDNAGPAPRVPATGLRHARGLGDDGVSGAA